MNMMIGAYDKNHIEIGKVYISEEAPGHFWLKVNFPTLWSNGYTTEITSRTLHIVSKHDLEGYLKLGYTLVECKKPKVKPLNGHFVKG